MNIENIHDALNLLDDEMIETVQKLRAEKTQIIKMRTKKTWMRWVSIAACLCIVVSVYATNGFKFQQNKGAGSGGSIEIGADGAHDSDKSNGFSDKGSSIVEDDSLHKEENLNARMVECSNGIATLSLCIPKGWNYELIEPAKRGADEFGICFWPEDQTEGKIKFMYYEAWGVCGTGLEEIKIQLGEYSAYQGTYDNNEVWDFISFIDTQGRYVVLNEGADVWWDVYGEEVMSILATVQITEK